MAISRPTDGSATSFTPVRWDSGIYRPQTRFLSTVEPIEIPQIVEDAEHSQPKKPTKTRRNPCKTLWSKKWVKVLVKNALVISMLTSIFLAVLTGCLMRLRSEPYDQYEIFYIRFPGLLFNRLLKVLLIPYITASVISAVGRVSPELLLHIVLRTILYFILTTLLASVLGLLLGLLFQLVETQRIQAEEEPGELVTGLLEIVLQLLINLIPYNIIVACMYTEHIDVTEYRIQETGIETDELVPEPRVGTNYMGIFMFSMFVGLALQQLGPAVEWMFSLTDTVKELMHLISQWVLWVSPVGLFFLIISHIITIDNFSYTFRTLSFFLLFFFIGIFLHCFITAVAIFFAITKTNPLVYSFNLSWGIFSSFATGTSVSAIPFMLFCVEGKNDVDPRVAQLVIPFGANINMDGRALFIVISVSYFCYLGGIKMTFFKIFCLLVFTVLGSVDISPNDERELQSLVFEVSRYMGLDPNLIQHEIDTLFSLGWLLERVQACANVYGDALGAKIVHVLVRKRMEQEDSLRNLPASESDLGGYVDINEKMYGFQLSTL